MSYYSVGRIKENDIDYTYDLTPDGSLPGGDSGGSNNPNDPTIFPPVIATPGTSAAEVIPSYGSDISAGPTAESPSIFKTPPPAVVSKTGITTWRSTATANTQYYKRPSAGYQTPRQKLAAAVGLALSKAEPTAIQHPASDGGDAVVIGGSSTGTGGGYAGMSIGNIASVRSAVIVGGLGLAAFLLYKTFKK